MPFTLRITFNMLDCNGNCHTQLKQTLTVLTYAGLQSKLHDLTAAASAKPGGYNVRVELMLTERESETIVDFVKAEDLRA